MWGISPNLILKEIINISSVRGAGGWTQGLVFAKQALSLNAASNSFCIGYFWDGILLYTRANLPFYTSSIDKMTYVHHHTPAFRC
jgi:hypothetical protein